jgi:WD40 repeat protein
VQVWDVLTGKHSYVYHGHSDTVAAIAWSSDGRFIASASANQSVQVWDAATGGHVLTHFQHIEVVISPGMVS